MGNLTKNELEAIRIDRRYRALWWLLAFSSGTICFVVACNAYVKMHDEPAWLKLATGITALVSNLIGPGILFVLSERRQRRVIKEVASRLAVLEKAVDPKRTSSGLLTDGTDPEIGRNS